VALRGWPASRTAARDGPADHRSKRFNEAAFGPFERGRCIDPDRRDNAPTVEQVVTTVSGRCVDGSQFTYEVAAGGGHPSPAGHEQLGHAIAAAVTDVAGVIAPGGR
jgi:hypothetical protein